MSATLSYQITNSKNMISQCSLKTIPNLLICVIHVYLETQQGDHLDRIKILKDQIINSTLNTTGVHVFRGQSQSHHAVSLDALLKTIDLIKTSFLLVVKCENQLQYQDQSCLLPSNMINSYSSEVEISDPRSIVRFICVYN